MSRKIVGITRRRKSTQRNIVPLTHIIVYHFIRSMKDRGWFKQIEDIKKRTTTPSGSKSSQKIRIYMRRPEQTFSICSTSRKHNENFSPRASRVSLVCRLPFCWQQEIEFAFHLIFNTHSPAKAITHFIQNNFDKHIHTYTQKHTYLNIENTRIHVEFHIRFLGVGICVR